MNAARRGPRRSSDRVAGLLVMLPWVMRRGRVRLADMAAEFGLTEDELAADLVLASMCGVPPYTPDALVDVWIDGDEVVAEVRTFFHRPMRLSASEVFALTTMVAAALELPGADGNGPLASAVTKLRALLPSDDAVSVDIAPPDEAEVLTAAARGSRWVEIDYFTPATAATTTRRILPRLVFERGGRWYVAAEDDRSGERREFRLDRMRRCVDTGEVGPSGEPGEPGTWFADAPLRVRLLVAKRARWIVEPYPSIEREVLPDGSLRVTLGASSEHWLGRLLVRGGADIEVESPAEAAAIGRDTARLVLARYGVSTSD